MVREKLKVSTRTLQWKCVESRALELGQSRLLEVDNRVVVPAKTHLRIIVTSAALHLEYLQLAQGMTLPTIPYHPDRDRRA